MSNPEGGMSHDPSEYQKERLAKLLIQFKHPLTAKYVLWLELLDVTEKYRVRDAVQPFCWSYQEHIWHPYDWMEKQ